MEILLLDVRTLAFVSALGGFIMMMTMAALYLAGNRQKGLIEWSLTGLFIGSGHLIGHLMLTLSSAMPDWLTAASANSLIGAGYAFLLIGIQRYLGLKTWTLPLLCLVAAMYALTLFQPVLQHSLQARIVSQSSWYVLMIGVGAYLLWTASDPKLRLFRRVVAGVMFLFSALLLARVAYAVFAPHLTTSFIQDPFQILAFLGSMTFYFVLSMAIVILLYREKELGLKDMAFRDALTGLFNRYSLGEMAVKHFAQGKRYGTPTSLIALDLDHFKPINDRHGHDAGDKVLQGVADMIRNNLRQSDLAFRTGGEEFLVLMPCTRLDEAQTVAHRLRREINGARWTFNDAEASITASFGVICLNPETETWDQALIRVDAALYEAKRAGRNTVRTHGNGPKLNHSMVL